MARASGSAVAAASASIFLQRLAGGLFIGGGQVGEELGVADAALAQRADGAQRPAQQDANQSFHYLQLFHHQVIVSVAAVGIFHAVGPGAIDLEAVFQI